MKHEEKEKLLEQLKKTPIVQFTCEKTGISRATYYRWRKEDSVFTQEADKALAEGRELMNDYAEGQLIAAIKEGNLGAITYWLRHQHPAYANRLEVKHALVQEELTPEQEVLVREALRLAAFSSPDNDTNDHEH